MFKLIRLLQHYKLQLVIFKTYKPAVCTNSFEFVFKVKGPSWCLHNFGTESSTNLRAYFTREKSIRHPQLSWIPRLPPFFYFTLFFFKFQVLVWNVQICKCTIYVHMWVFASLISVYVSFNYFLMETKRKKKINFFPVFI